MKKLKRMALAIMLILAIFIVNLGSNMIIPITVHAASVEINKIVLVLEVGDKAQLKVTGTKKKISWSSDNPSIAMVSKKGKVTAKGIGEASIEAIAGDNYLYCTVYVVDRSKLTLPITKNETKKVLIQTVSGSKSYPLNSYMIFSKEGENIIIDPTDMPHKELIDLKPAAITNTHTHQDHVDAIFSSSYNCPMLSFVEGTLNTKDFHIFSILSSHKGDTINESEKNVIMVYEVDGLRIAHMGDIGQTKLTDDQLKKLGEIDIAIMQFDNSWSDMSLKNRKGFNLMAQLNPKIIIPTNDSAEALTALKDEYKTIHKFVNNFSISKEELPKTTEIYQITNTHKYK